MAISGISLHVRTYLAAALTTAGVPCLAYDEWDVPLGSMAALGAAAWDLSDGQDQAYGVRSMTVHVLVYQLVDGGASQSIAYQEAALETILDGLGSDRTLGGKVVHSDVGGEAVQSFYREPNGQTISMVSVPVTVFPFAHVGV